MKQITSIFFLLFLFKYSSSAQTVNGLSFKDYPAKAYKGTKAKPDFSSNKNAAAQQAYVTTAYKKNKPNFAGNYVSITWPAPGGYVTGVIIDARDGKIYNLPNTEKNRMNYCSEGTANGGMLKSRMYVITDCGSGDGPAFYWVFLWDEAGKKFIKVATP